MNPTQVDAYLRRLGVQHPGWPTVEVLRELHLRHLQTVPFENLSVHLGEKIVLEEARLVEKVVGARRGGFCYELNGAFGALLAALGFDVTLLMRPGVRGRGSARDPVRPSRAAGGDGGWGRVAGRRRVRGAQPLPAGVRGAGRAGGSRRDLPDRRGGARCRRGAERGRCGEEGRGDAADLDVLMGGRSQYRLEVRPRVLGDFVAGAWWHSTSSASHFTRSLVCSRVTEDGGRITLSGRTFKVTAADGAREERELETDEEVLGAYRERFGIELDRVPTVRHPDGNG